MNPEGRQKQEAQNSKDRLQKKFRMILSRQLTPAQIDDFAEKAVEDLVKLAQEAANSYAQEKGLVFDEHRGKSFEDDAFEYYGLQDISSLLDTAQKKLDEMKRISEFIEKKILWKHLDEVITPPEARPDSPAIVGGSGEEITHDLFPRLKTILYILKERGIVLDEITVMDGIITPQMMRKTSYVTICVPTIDRLVQVCDEEGNASYIFRLSKVNVEQINRMTKKEKGELIEGTPGIGIRFQQGPNWRDRAESYLFGEIPIEDKLPRSDIPHSQEVLTPTYGEMDPWRGFAVDEKGRHWAYRYLIAKMIGRSYAPLDTRLNDKRIESRPILDVSGRIQRGFCIEQLRILFPEMFDSKGIVLEKKGEWKGFWTDPNTGRHWATIQRLTEKFGVGAWQTVKDYAEINNLPSMRLASFNRFMSDCYCYEDFAESESFLEFLTAPRVEETGPWAGFWTDGQGRHWASIGVLASRHNVSRDVIDRFINELHLSGKRLLSRKRSVSLAFCLEDLEADKNFIEAVNSSKVDQEGDWMGFLTDKKGNHWGAIYTIAKKLGFSVGKITRVIDKHQELRSQVIRDTMGRIRPRYCLEEIQGILNSQRSPE